MNKTAIDYPQYLLIHMCSMFRRGYWNFEEISDKEISMNEVWIWTIVDPGQINDPVLCSIRNIVVFLSFQGVCY